MNLEPVSASSSSNSNPISLNLEPFTFLFERLTDLLTNEINYFRTDKLEEIRSLQHAVETAQNLLKDVDQVQRQAIINPEVQSNVRRIMAIIDEIEDFIDSQGAEADARLSLGSLKRKRSAVKGARQIKEKLNDVVQSLKGYQLTSDSPHVIPRRPRYQTQPDNLKQEFIVDLKEDIQTYVAELVTRKVDLAVYGMGGAGKTTTARLLYRNDAVIKSFNKNAWVCVSQQWDKTQVLQHIGFQVFNHLQKDDAKLVTALKKFLSKNSCFFVLDDVWDVKALLELLPILRSVNSRILVTTRNKEIFNFPQNDFSIHKMRLLTPTESLDLFSMTIRRNRRDDWSLEGEFLRLGEVMLEKCGGLPLAIIALGGLLSSKETIQDWESIKEDVVRRIMRHKGSDDDYGVVTEILELSYIDLPYWLKPCFLYLGIFPEDYKIEVRMLFQLWIAEGFVKVEQDSSSKTLEIVAMDFLDELTDRCMVEIVKKGYGGEVIHIQIHDLMRDLCIRKADNLRLFQILHHPTSSSTFIDLKSCRIIIEDGKTLMGNSNQSFKVRSLFAFDIQREFKHFTLPQMKYLRVLCLYRLDLKKSNSAIGDLILLRYLLLERCDVSSKNLSSISKLRNLLSFTYSSNEKEWPTNLVGQMEYLRHLRFACKGMSIAKLGVGNKPNLQTLKGDAGEWLTTELSQASVTLQELSLDEIHSQAQLQSIYAFVTSRCRNLRTLYMQVKNVSGLEIELTKLQPRHCSTLELRGKIMSTGQLEFPCRLVKLCLTNTHIREEENFKQALSELNELRYLELVSNAYVGEVLAMVGLAKLQQLKFVDMSNLKEWRIENGGLSKLEKLEILSCENMERLPQEIRWINLKQLILDSMSESFDKRLQSSEDGSGEDYDLVKHIPSVDFRSSLF